MIASHYAIGYVTPNGRIVLLSGECHADKATARRRRDGLQGLRDFAAGGDKLRMKYRIFKVDEVPDDEE